MSKYFPESVLIVSRLVQARCLRTQKDDEAGQTQAESHQGQETVLGWCHQRECRGRTVPGVAASAENDVPGIAVPRTA